MATSWSPAEKAEICTKYMEIFAFRNRTDEGAVDAQKELFASTPSALLRHEIAYALGQMQRLDAVPFLSALLTDTSEDPVVRHEAAEALGAINDPDSVELLRVHATDPAPEVADTCNLALARLEYHISKGMCACEKRPQHVLRLEQQHREQQQPPEEGAQEMQQQQQQQQHEPEPESAPAAAAEPHLQVGGFVSVDPAPAAPAAPTRMLKAQLINQSLPLFERYRALFALRDAVAAKGDEAAVLAICAAFGTENALLKHEVAFVLGQLEHTASVQPLCEVIAKEEEHPMVRHEAAEALGAIGSPDAIETLNKYSTHECDLLRESVWVALHMYDREAFLAKGICV